MPKRVLGLGVAAVAALSFGVWWWTRITPPVTEAEARAYLDRIVAAARARDFDKMCRLNGAVHNCRVQLAQAGEYAVPPSPPRVVGTRYYKEGDGSVAGRALVVEGVDGCGKNYRTEVFVFRENRFHFKSINAVYWSNYKIIEGNVLSPDPAPTTGPGATHPPASSGLGPKDSCAGR
jgi:hypothetical protein